MFMKEFQEAMDILGVSVLPAAGQAHWQHGKTERHGGWLKLMLQHLKSEHGIKTTVCLGRPTEIPSEPKSARYARMVKAIHGLPIPLHLTP
jgi:hypothetical protein